MTPPSIDIVFGSLTPPEQLPAGAALAERLGFDGLWFSEDCWFTGGLSGLTALLDSTERIPAGLGIASVMSRHPAVLAMELAGLARMHPGRVRAGLGLGNRVWLEQMGLLPDRPLGAVADTVEVVRTLLAGHRVDTVTSAHRLAGITLDFPPATPPPVWLGAVGPRALRLAGRVADGVLLSVISGPSYVRWAREQVAAGAAEAGRPVPPITAYVLTAVDDDESRAREAVRGAVRMFADAEAHTDLVGRAEHGAAIRAGGPVADDWVDELAAAGPPATVTARLQALLDAGADRLGLWLFPAEDLPGQLRAVAGLRAGLTGAVHPAAGSAHLGPGRA